RSYDNPMSAFLFIDSVINAAFLQYGQHVGQAFVPPDIAEKISLYGLSFVNDVHVVPTGQLFHGLAHFGLPETEQTVLPTDEGVNIHRMDYCMAIFDCTLFARA